MAEQEALEQSPFSGLSVYGVPFDKAIESIVSSADKTARQIKGYPSHMWEEDIPGPLKPIVGMIPGAYTGRLTDLRELKEKLIAPQVMGLYKTALEESGMTNPTQWDVYGAGLGQSFGLEPPQDRGALLMGGQSHTPGMVDQPPARHTGVQPSLTHPGASELTPENVSQFQDWSQQRITNPQRSMVNVELARKQAEPFPATPLQVRKQQVDEMTAYATIQKMGAQSAYYKDLLNLRREIAKDTGNPINKQIAASIDHAREAIDMGLEPEPMDLFLLNTWKQKQEGMPYGSTPLGDIYSRRAGEIKPPAEPAPSGENFLQWLQRAWQGGQAPTSPPIAPGKTGLEQVSPDLENARVKNQQIHDAILQQLSTMPGGIAAFEGKTVKKNGQHYKIEKGQPKAVKP